MSLAEPVRLAEGQVAASGAVLARAFANDPFFTYVLSDPVERERLMPPLMAAWTRYGLLFGEVYVTAGPVEASAIWLPPNLIRTEEQRDRAGLTAVVSTFSDGAQARYEAMGLHTGRIREAAPSVPHWHLRAAGSRPRNPAVASRALARRPGRGRVPAVHRAAAERAPLPAVRLRDRRRGGRPRRGTAPLVHAAAPPPHHAAAPAPTSVGLPWAPRPAVALEIGHRADAIAGLTGKRRHARPEALALGSAPPAGVRL
jgi:hypothetical protein